MEDIGTVTTTSNGSFVKVKYTLLSVKDNELSKKKNAKLYEDVADRIINMPLNNEQYSMQIEAMGYEISGLQDVINKYKEKIDLKNEIIFMYDNHMIGLAKSLKSLFRMLIAGTVIIVSSVILFLIFS